MTRLLKYYGSEQVQYTEAYSTDGHDKGIEISAHPVTFSGEIGACRVTGISYPERFVKWNFPHSCWILKPVCGFSRQDVRQIFFSVRISFPNITMSWPITLQTCIQRHNIISVDPDSFSSGVHIRHLFYLGCCRDCYRVLAFPRCFYALLRDWKK